MQIMHLHKGALILVLGGAALLLVTYKNTPAATEGHNSEPAAGRDSQLEAPNSVHAVKPDGSHKKQQQLRGKVFSAASKIGSMDDEMVSTVTVSLVKSLSPAVVNHIKEIFNDDHNECEFFATVPAMIRKGNTIEIVQRIWLAQYEHMKAKYSKEDLDMGKMVDEWMNTWQENHFYHMRLDENYNQLAPGELLGIPSTTNVKFIYRSDGLMDPRLLKVADNHFLLYHSWLVDANSNNDVGGRPHIWDMDRHVKRRLWPHMKLLRTEINWIPMDVKGELYITYSIDPLRVMKCETMTGDCHIIFEQDGSSAHPFIWSNDHLRGGTPWVEYKYPYYITIGHSVSATLTPLADFSMYAVNIIVLSVLPWRVVYVSRNLQADAQWMTSEPLIRNHTIIGSFYYPTGIILWDEDTADISCHLNDAGGYILRLRGLSDLMKEVIHRDSMNPAQQGASVRVAQQYTLEASKADHPGWHFVGDIIENTVEQPEPEVNVVS